MVECWSKEIDQERLMLCSWFSEFAYCCCRVGVCGFETRGVCLSFVLRLDAPTWLTRREVVLVNRF
jgi:hypothetical protein